MLGIPTSSFLLGPMFFLCTFKVRWISIQAYQLFFVTTGLLHLLQLLYPHTTFFLHLYSTMHGSSIRVLTQIINSSIPIPHLQHILTNEHLGPIFKDSNFLKAPVKTHIFLTNPSIKICTKQMLQSSQLIFASKQSISSLRNTSYSPFQHLRNPKSPPRFMIHWDASFIAALPRCFLHSRLISQSRRTKQEVEVRENNLSINRFP